jgi:hypothetical protein
LSVDRFLPALLVGAFLTATSIAPARAASVTLTWTAPGADSLTGQAARYDLRYSNAYLNPTLFAVATPVPAMPAPAPSGTIQTVTVNGLNTGLTYYFAIKTADATGNWSGMSNVVSRRPVESAGDPSGVNLFFSVPAPNPARGLTRFGFGLPQAMTVVVEVFDVAGRRVRLLDDTQHSAGTENLPYDLSDDRGVRLAEGLYLVRAKLGESVFTRRLVVTR